MPAPYQQGQALAWIEIDTEGLRVHRTTVESIEGSTSADRWTIATDRGVTTVDAAGVGAQAVPLEPDIEADLYVHGDGFLVTSTLLGLEHGVDQDRVVDEGDDLGLD